MVIDSCVSVEKILWKEEPEVVTAHVHRFDGRVALLGSAV